MVKFCIYFVSGAITIYLRITGRLGKNKAQLPPTNFANWLHSQHHLCKKWRFVNVLTLRFHFTLIRITKILALETILLKCFLMILLQLIWRKRARGSLELHERRRAFRGQIEHSTVQSTRVGGLVDGELHPTPIPLAGRSNAAKCLKWVELTMEGFLEEANLDEDFLKPL